MHRLHDPRPATQKLSHTVRAHAEGGYSTPSFRLIIMDPKPLFLATIYLYDLLLSTPS